MTKKEVLYGYMVGATGFEPVTFAPPVQCATGLRHAPMIQR